MDRSATLIQMLRQRFLEPLPGPEAQSKLEPEIRKTLRMKAMANAGSPRESAVMLLLFPIDEVMHLLFIQRAEYEGVHSGQIAFPGGRYEESDADFKATAMRETAEETGIVPGDITVIGKLTSLYIPPSNFNVHPYVGFIPFKPVFNPDPVEVAQIINIPLAEIINPAIIKQKTITTSDGYVLDVPCYVFENLTIWGATSMILSEFLEVISSMPDLESL